MLKFDGSSNFYSNYLEVINQKVSLHSDTPDIVSISYDDEGKKLKHHKSITEVLFSSSGLRSRNRDVEIIFKVESAFHCLVSKFYADYPHLNGVSFYKLGQEVHGTDDATVVLIEIYNILRLIRNKFHHDKFDGLSWDSNRNLTVKGDENLIITEHGVSLSVYIVWYCLKNNMEHLYNRVILNYLYFALVSNVKEISYGFKNKKITSLKLLKNPWKKITHYKNRNIVEGEIIKVVKNGFLIDRQNCLIDHPHPNELGQIELKKCLYRRLDYRIKLNETEYLIPDEYFFNYDDGDEAFISNEDIEKFIFFPNEMANF